MSIRVVIDDHGSEISVQVVTSGSYNPDIVDDLSTRAVAVYRESLATRCAIYASTTTGDEDSTDIEE